MLFEYYAVECGEGELRAGVSDSNVQLTSTAHICFIAHEPFADCVDLSSELAIRILPGLQ